MGRPAINEVEKIRKQAIKLSLEDFTLLLRDLEILQEIREEVREATAEVEAGK